MHPTDLLSKHLKKVQQPMGKNPLIKGICCVTGQETDCLPKKLLIGDSFTDWSLLAAPQSDGVGINVYTSWTYGTREEGKKRDFCIERHSCWYVDENEIIRVKRAEIREIVLNGAPGDTWAGWVTTSYKKHGSIRAVVNQTPYGMWGFDDHKPDCRDIDKVKDWWSRLRYFQTAGIGRQSLENGDAPPGVIKGQNLKVWFEFMAWSKGRRQSALYRFLCYLLPSKEELKCGYV